MPGPEQALLFVSWYLHSFNDAGSHKMIALLSEMDYPETAVLQEAGLFTDDSLLPALKGREVVYMFVKNIFRVLATHSTST